MVDHNNICHLRIWPKSEQCISGIEWTFWWIWLVCISHGNSTHRSNNNGHYSATNNYTGLWKHDLHTTTFQKSKLLIDQLIDGILIEKSFHFANGQGFCDRNYDWKLTEVWNSRKLRTKFKSKYFNWLLPRTTFRRIKNSGRFCRL